jgi:hypothetical protein
MAFAGSLKESGEMEPNTLKKKMPFPPLRRETFRGHHWYRYIDEYLKCGQVELPKELQPLIIAVLNRIGYDSFIHDGKTEKTPILTGNHKRPPYYPDNAAYAKMSIQEHILLELGGPEFTMMTGGRSFMAGENTLGISLPPIRSGANLLYIKKTGSEVYSMRFVRFCRRQGRLDKNGRLIITTDTMEEIESFDGVFSGTLRELYDEVIGGATLSADISPNGKPTFERKAK